MNRKTKIITTLTMLVIGMTACAGLPGNSQSLDINNIPSQEQPLAGQAPQLNLASAAEQLNVTEDELKAALGPPGQGPPDLAIAAGELGVTEQQLIDALGVPTESPANGAPQVPQGQSSSQTPNMFSMGTITLMITMTFFMQGSLILASKLWIKSYKGVLEASIATFAFSFGYMAVAFGSPPGPVNGYISNLLIISGFALFYLAICRFTDSPLNRPLVYGVFPFGVLALTLSAFLISQLLPMLYVSYVIGIIFTITTVVVLYYSDYQRYKLSAYLTAIPLFVYSLVMVGRSVAGFISRTEITPGPSISGTTSALVLYISSFLWTAGFILMLNQRLHSDLDDLAMNDALTRVRNRRAMQEMLSFEMRRVDQEVRDFSIILLDIDHFKHVNDTYGHDVGDIVLQWLASTLQSGMRVQDVVARWGGEEFLILLPDTSLEEAMQIAERLRIIIEQSVIGIPSGTLQITFSGGVSCSTSSREVSHLCKIADQALYIAKETRNRVLSQDAIPAAELV